MFTDHHPTNNQSPAVHGQGNDTSANYVAT